MNTNNESFTTKNYEGFVQVESPKPTPEFIEILDNLQMELDILADSAYKFFALSCSIKSINNDTEKKDVIADAKKSCFTDRFWESIMRLKGINENLYATLTHLQNMFGNNQ